MRRFRIPICQRTSDLPSGALAIGAGLAILIVAITYPGLPAVTGMALVILGTTGATLARLRGNASLLPVLLAHLFAYGSLYALFVGAVLDAGSRSGIGMTAVARFDFVLSICPLAVAFERVWRELQIGRISE